MTDSKPDLKPRDTCDCGSTLKDRLVRDVPRVHLANPMTVNREAIADEAWLEAHRTHRVTESDDCLKCHTCGLTYWRRKP